MSIGHRVERLERHRRPYRAARVETIETGGDGDTAGQARVREALVQAEAIAGPWQPGQPVRVVEVVRPRAEETATW